MKDFFKEFKPTSWSIDNRKSIYFITLLLAIAGVVAYNNLPKEQFPDIVIPTIFVNTIYPGASPADIENLITKPIEKEIKAISGLKKLTSQSVQDYSIVTAEFETDVKVSEAKQKVKDAVDKAKSDLPNDLLEDPSVMEVNFSDMPIMYVNISGDYDLNRLKKYSDDLKDKIESLPEITRVDMVGALDREIQINVDKYKMDAAGVTLAEIERSIKFENMTISGGQVSTDDMKRSISISGEFKNLAQFDNIIIKSSSGAVVYLRDIAQIVDSFKEKESYARLDHKNVITLNVVKRSGENLIDASDKIREIITDLQTNSFPKNLKVSITGDQSTKTRVTLHDLINTIIIGFILVTVVLMFFMGVTNAFFVAMSVPLSCFLAFLIMPSLGLSMNMIVLFSLLLALGIVVDDAIVVIENTHRIYQKGDMSIVQAAKTAAGEVFIPVFSGTMTTLAPFVPLLFWKGIIGKFMIYLPITLIITLIASLLVAYIVNPVFAVDFMKKDEEEYDAKHTQKRSWTGAIIMAVIAVLLYGTGKVGMGNFVVLFIVLLLLYKFFLKDVIYSFQNSFWPKVQNAYAKLVGWAIDKKRPVWLMLGLVGLFFFSIIFTAIRSPKIVFFPQADPNFVYVYLSMPIGTSAEHTDKVASMLENKVYEILGDNNPLVESVITNVAVGATDPAEGDRTSASNKAKVAIAFVEFSERHGKSTAEVLDKIRANVKGIPGAVVSVEKESNGPPTGKAISIEVSGDDLGKLTTTSIALKKFLDSLQIAGVEELKSDIQASKPQIMINIDRERANLLGISTAQVGGDLRNAIFGKEVSKFRDQNDEYPIMVRFKESQRGDLAALMNSEVAYRDMAMGGMLRQIPLSSFSSIEYNNTFGVIKRKDQKRLVTISSNVLNGYNPNEVVAKVDAAIKTYPRLDGITVKMGGEQEEQNKTSAFLGTALLVSLGLILLILVTLFNSISKPLIILSEIFFSIIGVLIGFSLFKMEISTIMVGVGIIALAGIVVRNGILLVEFTDLLREQGVPLKEALIEAGRARMTPVLLTATATMLGLVPLAIGLNIDFVTLFTELNPHIFFGGDSVAFWGPLSWTMIFGLSFATFLTLVMVPVMYLLDEKITERVVRLIKK
jgi:multidrug efflux pump subunit AcrB